MGDRSGNIRWWDVTTGQSSSFNTHRDGIRRIKFSPVVPGDRTRGRIAVLFYDNTFSVFDLVSSTQIINFFKCTFYFPLSERTFHCKCCCHQKLIFHVVSDLVTPHFSELLHICGLQMFNNKYSVSDVASFAIIYLFSLEVRNH